VWMTGGFRPVGCVRDWFTGGDEVNHRTVGGCELTMEIISLSCDLVVRKKQFVNKLWINL
jgi:hypothetical protein